MHETTDLPRDELDRFFSRLFELAGDQWLTPEEAAADAGVEPQTIYNWLTRRSPPLPAQKQGRKWRIRRRDLLNFMRANPVSPGADVIAGFASLPGYEELLFSALRALWLGLELNIAENYERETGRSSPDDDEALLGAKYAVWEAKSKLDKMLGENKSEALVRLLRAIFLTPSRMPRNLATALLNSPQLDASMPLNLWQQADS